MIIAIILIMYVHGPLQPEQVPNLNHISHVTALVGRVDHGPRFKIVRGLYLCALKNANLCHFVFYYYCHCINYCNYFTGSSSFKDVGTVVIVQAKGIVWCRGTPSTVEFSGSAATCSPRKRFTAVTGWT